MTSFSSSCILIFSSLRVVYREEKKPNETTTKEKMKEKPKRIFLSYRSSIRRRRQRQVYVRERKFQKVKDLGAYDKIQNRRKIWDKSRSKTNQTNQQRCSFRMFSSSTSANYQPIENQKWVKVFIGRLVQLKPTEWWLNIFSFSIVHSLTNKQHDIDVDYEERGREREGKEEKKREFSTLRFQSVWQDVRKETGSEKEKKKDILVRQI